jgi:replicative DNA helicase
MIVLGGSPGMGKTALVLNLALNAALPMHREAFSNVPAYSVMFFSMDLSRERLRERALSQLSRVGLSRIGSGQLSPDERAALDMADREFLSASFHIVGAGAGNVTPPGVISPSMVLERAVELTGRLNRDGLPPLGLIVLDYIQLMKADVKRESFRREMADASAGLKSLSKELNLSVLCCAQLRQHMGKSQDLCDIKGSDEIGEAADIVAFILRRELLRPDMPEFEGRAELHIKKHRNGPTGVVRLDFIKRCSCFVPSVHHDLDDPS